MLLFVRDGFKTMNEKIPTRDVCSSRTSNYPCKLTKIANEIPGHLYSKNSMQRNTPPTWSKFIKRKDGINDV